jgi:hypothetical protein
VAARLGLLDLLRHLPRPRLDLRRKEFCIL